MPGFDFTAAQAAAITHRGGPLLISAGAGSGKTRVLVERLLNIIENEGEDIDRFLVITFTRAAAEELRGRILERLYQRLAEQPKNAHLRRQTTLIYSAQISTIHGFCAALLRENAHLCSVRADFRLLDEAEAEVIKAETLDDLLTERYRAMSPDFRSLADTMGAGRDDSALVKMIRDCHTALQGHPYPEKWLQEQINEPVCFSDAGETAWGRLLLRRAKSLCAYWTGRMEAALDLVLAHEQAALSYADSYEDTVTSLREFYAALQGGWDSACRFGQISFPKLKPLKGESDETVEKARLIRAKCQKSMAALTAGFAADSAAHLEDMAAVKPCIDELFRLVTDFSEAYSEEKLRRSALDFNDLEHMALKLLIDSDGAPTRQAREAAARYREILVDEYQDCNRVQDAIFSAICPDGNITMVGDVKQSIYRFRLADPSIFLDKYERYSDEPSPEGRRVVLADNFRSDSGVIDAVNGLFGMIMTKDLGELDYAGKEELRCAASPRAENAGAQFELHLTDTGGEDRVDGEARYIARRVRKLLESSMTVDGRPLRAEDIAVLLRSPKGREAVYASALRQEGIDASFQKAKESLSERREVIWALSILQITDNPRQDIPLITALRSPVWGFTADELSQIRSADKDGCFYEALCAAARQPEGPCRDKCAAFLEQLGQFRLCASDMPADRLINFIYEQTMLPALAEATAAGSSEGLYMLLDQARSYERSGYRGLFSFVSQIREAAENGSVSFSGPGGGGRGVLISSIHNSKGLEYPVVILANLSGRFNKMDLNKPLLIHPVLGAGCKRTDKRRGIEYPTLPKLAIAAQIDNETLSEEMRVLYVAMTRAKHKLIAVCSSKDAEKTINGIRANCFGPPEYQELEKCSSAAAWILTAAAALDWPVIMSQAPGSAGAFRTQAAGEAEGSFDAALAEKIKAGLDWRYSRAADTRLPSKLTATELKGGRLISETAEEADSLPPRWEAVSLKRPAFIGREEGLSPAERGSALHLVMQYIDFSMCLSREGIEAEKARLVEKRIITPQQADAADAGKILRFFSSESGRRVLSADRVSREFKFSLLAPAADYYPDGKGEILLQGVVDCFIEEDGLLSVIDFKTDRVPAGLEAERAEKYRPQLDAYASALEKITGKKVKQKLIYFFSSGKAINI